MKNLILIIFINILLVLFQESFFLEIFGSELNINFVLALGFSFFFANQESDALKSLLVGGLIIDLISTNIVGITSTIFILIMLIASFIKRNIFNGLGIQVLVLILSVVIYKFIMNFQNFSFSLNILTSGLLTFIVSFCLYLLISKLKNRFLSSEFRIRA